MAQSTKRLLEVKDLHKSFGRKEVVSGVSFDVKAGEIFGLLGSNGAGKTTTFRMVMGQLQPNAGEVLFEGQSITHLPMYQRAQRGMGYLAQEPSIFSGLSVEENILAILEHYETDSIKRSERLEELLDLLNLTPLRSQKSTQVSGGERRRLEVTRALVTNPQLLMLDEPFAGIDPKAVIDIKEILKTLKGKGISVMITDHNAYEILRLVDRGAILYEGKICVMGSPDEIAVDEEARRLYLGDSFHLH